MPAPTFALFHKIYPKSPNNEREPFDSTRHEIFANNVPSDLANEWHNFGFGAYGGGLLWTLAPDKPFLNPDDWQALDGTGIEVLRTAFGDVCVWQRENFVWLNIHSGKYYDLGSQIDILLNFTLIKDSFRKIALRDLLFKPACKRWGNLASDECFGFAPLPALGGMIAEEYVIKAKMREYAAMAAQVL